MFLHLLIALSIAAAVHAALLKERTRERVGEVALLWLLVGYCGIPMLAVSVASLLRPDRVAEMLGLPAGGPFQDFVSVALLGLAVAAILAGLYRGSALVVAAAAWAVYWAGATWIHVEEYGGLGAIDAHAFLHAFTSHGLVAVLLVAALVASGRLRLTR